MGARISASPEGTAPLHIDGTMLSPIDYPSPVASAQIKSCVLLAGLFANGTTSVTEPALSRDHTERMLPGFGVPVTQEGLRVSVTGPATLTACDVDVPGDISSAAFFIIAASILPDAEICLKNVGLNPTRTGIIEVLRTMEADIQLTSEREINGEPRADLIVRSATLKGTCIEGEIIPKLIDEIPILAVAATQAEGRTEIRDAGELRVKETDRIAAIATNLEKMGAEVETWEDGFAIEGPQPLHGTVIETFHDHRIAMAFAIAGLIARGETLITGAECAEISYRGFYETLKGLIHG
jgi:3-phosphoshikimate 1-carboxyvinyltransferase